MSSPNCCQLFIFTIFVPKFSKIPLAKKNGGYIYHSDHSIPKNVSFKQYKRRVMELVKKYGEY